MSSQLATAVENRFTAMDDKMKMHAAKFEQVQEELKVVKNEVKNTQSSVRAVQHEMAAIPPLLTKKGQIFYLRVQARAPIGPITDPAIQALKKTK
jgi:hypothetical protein